MRKKIIILSSFAAAIAAVVIAFSTVKHTNNVKHQDATQAKKSVSTNKYQSVKSELAAEFSKKDYAKVVVENNVATSDLPESHTEVRVIVKHKANIQGIIEAQSAINNNRATPDQKRLIYNIQQKVKKAAAKLKKGDAVSFGYPFNGDLEMIAYSTDEREIIPMVDPQS